MLVVNFRPQRSLAVVQHPDVEWVAPVLTLDGVAYDLSELRDGDTASHPVLGTVTRTGDDYTVSITLRYKHGAPNETTFPEPVTMTADGPVPLPPYAAPEPEEPAQ